MQFTPATPEDRRAMMDAIGVTSIDALFADVPDEVRLRRPLDLPDPLSEPSLLAHLRELAGKSADLDHYACFLGAGAYDHWIPTIVDSLIGRSEFYTSYTPYQAEISQGILQALYEYQTLMCRLTGMDVANASLYDGASALAEAAIICCAATGRSRILVAGTVHPEYLRTVQTYAHNQNLETVTVPWADGQIQLEALEQLLDESVAGILVQHPNFFGALEEMAPIGELAHRRGAMFVACVNPISLGVLKPPGEYDADLVVGEGQPLGNRISFGGPYLGFMAAKRSLMRRMPGRIVGQTEDLDGRRGFVLTLQTREQHIRRERAGSNICTNQSLNALAAAVYLATMGREGLQRIAQHCLQKAHYARDRILELDGFQSPWQAAFFHEFVVRTSADPQQLTKRLLDYQIIGGLPLAGLVPGLADGILFCVTEARTKEEIDRLVDALAALVG